MEQYLIDTNVVSDYFSATYPSNGLKFMDEVIDAIPNLSIIAASTLSGGFILITNNEKDFSNIKGLKIINPHNV